jgi:ParB-like chromosome segregation protein Spo0J
MITKGKKFTDRCNNDYTTYIIPIENLRPSEDLSRKITPENIDDYPIVIYADGDIQDGHHRYKYMIEKGQKEVRVILAHDIDEDSELDSHQWMPTLWEIYWA